jgi:phosphate:Na+ symporter
MLAESADAVLDGTNEDLVTIEAMDDEVDSLYASIVDYLGRLSKRELLSHETAELFQLMEATNNLEAIGDIVETNLVQLGLSRLENDLTLTTESRELVRAFHWEVLTAYELAMLAVTQKNEAAAHRCSAMKTTINSMARKADRYQASRLVSDDPNRVGSYAFETDYVAHLKRIYWFTRRTARIAIPASDRTDD